MAMREPMPGLQHGMEQGGHGARDAGVDVRQALRFEQADEQAEPLVDLVDDEAVEGDAVVEQPVEGLARMQATRVSRKATTS
jgi:hypothetical protein